MRDVFDVDDARSEALIQGAHGENDVGPSVGDNPIGKPNTKKIALQKRSKLVGGVPFHDVQANDLDVRECQRSSFVDSRLFGPKEAEDALGSNVDAEINNRCPTAVLLRCRLEFVEANLESPS